MPHFRVDDALHSHPKAQRAGDDALGLWTRAGSFCMAYLTDGFVPEWWVKQQPNGTRKAKKLVAVGLWHSDAEKDGEKGYQFHEFTGPGRQDSKAQIEAEREKWRKKKAAQRGDTPKDSPQESPRVSPRDTSGESPGESSRVTRDPTQPNPKENYSPNEVSALNVDPPRATERGLSEPVSASASRIVHDTLRGRYPAAVMTTLRLKASELMTRDGTTAAVLAEAIRRWEAKPDVGPAALPMFVAEAVKAVATPNEVGQPHKMRAFAELAAEERARENAHATARRELES